MKKIYIKLLVFSVFLSVSCNLDGDLRDPNVPITSDVDADLVMNSIQLSFGDFYQNASNSVAPLVRMRAMTGGINYQVNYSPQNQNRIWTDAYKAVLSNIQLLIPIAEEKNFEVHIGVAKILEAYTYLTLVDIFGDVPQSEAFNIENFNPKADNGSEVYNYAIKLIGEGRDILKKKHQELEDDKDVRNLGRDIFYGGDLEKWIALSNSLELKAWVNVSLVDETRADAEIATLISADGSPVDGVDLIDTESENFTYKYGSETNPAGSRHPLYDQYYRPSSGSASGYLSNYFLHEVFGKWDKADFSSVSKVVQDPRWRYYFHRQIGSVDPATPGFDANGLSCVPGLSNAPTHYQSNWNGEGGTWNGQVFCVFEPGFMGRDHGNDSGIPPDGDLITCVGVYPAGGRLDVESSLPSSYYTDGATRGDGANGNGIIPIYMSFFTDFLIAEIKSRNSQDGKEDMLNAVSNSIDQVRNFSISKGQVLPDGVEPSQVKYTAHLSKLYDEENVKLDIICKEAWISMFGNSIEAYNMYRRTGAPKYFQPLLNVSTDPYFRSLVYPTVYESLNINAKQKDPKADNPVFWDPQIDIN